MLGYTRATMAITTNYEYVNKGEFLKNLPKFELFPETWKYEGGIASNRR